MIVHLFNSSSVSGPETLVIPQLKELAAEWGEIEVWNFEELRLGDRRTRTLSFAREFGLNVKSVSVRSRLDFQSIRRLNALIEERKPKLIHAHDVKASLYLFLAKLFCDRRSEFPKILSTHHGVQGRFGFWVKCYEWIYRKGILKYFDRVLAVSSEDFNLLEKSGIRGSRLMLHLNGVDRPLIETGARVALQNQVRKIWEKDLGLSLERKKILGVVARLSGEKNHSSLILALKELKSAQQLDQIVCLLFGEGDLRSELQKQVNEWGLQNEVVFMGYRKGVAHELVGLDLLLSLSFAEGLPVNLIEAAWSGTPVLSTCVGGVKDLLPVSEPLFQVCLLSKNADSSELSARILKFIKDREPWLLAANAFQERVQAHFSGRSWRLKLAEIYQRLK